MKYLVVNVILITLTFHMFKSFIVDDPRKIFVLQKNITSLYITAGGHSNGREVITLLHKYIDELKELQTGMNNDEKLAINTLKEVYIAGGPPHIHQAPLEKLTVAYKWSTTDIEEFKSAVTETKSLWGKVSAELDKFATEALDYPDYKV